jgi:anti-anti-sigma factor
MTCARCGLSLRLHGTRPLRLDRCPRCFAFAGVSVPLHNGTLSVLRGGAAEGPTPPVAGDQASFGHLVVCTEHYAGATLVSLQGKLDIASEQCFEQALRRAWARSCEQIVIDLSELEFIDAVGLKALVRARDHTLARGLQLFLMRGPPNVHRMFELTGTLDLFTFHD